MSSGRNAHAYAIKKKIALSTRETTIKCYQKMSNNKFKFSAVNPF